MYECPPVEPRRRFLLPFEAEPQAVGLLRRTVGLQLATWGASALADAALLAVSELATNVIRHVGEGAPAALVMETRDDRICVELHDTSRAMPLRGQAGPDDERGHGLGLVAAVSDHWFAMATPGGKAVCCEFTLPVPRKIYDHRAARGSEAVALYTLQWGAAGTRPLGNRSAVQAAAADLITDLLHWLAANGQDPDTVLDHAQTHFEAETAEVAHGVAPRAPVAPSVG
jgi:anti-sigma regulatory factor (Ser/Thr protein kinase)